jgi:hypothetical protein
MNVMTLTSKPAIISLSVVILGVLPLALYLATRKESNIPTEDAGAGALGLKVLKLEFLVVGKGEVPFELRVDGKTAFIETEIRVAPQALIPEIKKSAAVIVFYDAYIESDLAVKTLDELTEVCSSKGVRIFFVDETKIGPDIKTNVVVAGILNGKRRFEVDGARVFGADELVKYVKDSGLRRIVFIDDADGSVPDRENAFLADLRNAGAEVVIPTKKAVFDSSLKPADPFAGPKYTDPFK